MSQVTMSKEVAQAICNLKRNPDFPVFLSWLSGIADAKQHQLITAPADMMQVLQGECRSFMVQFNAIDGAEAALEQLTKGNHEHGPT